MGASQASACKGTVPPLFARDVLLDEETRNTGTDEEAKYLATSIMSAGSDNPGMTMNRFAMSALCYSETLRKAQEEACRTCGHATRLPAVDDMVGMPYLCALVEEVVR